jgi:hypothetical protein
MTPWKDAADKMLKRRAQWEALKEQMPPCAGCGEPLREGALAYGLTVGVIDSVALHGFTPCNSGPCKAVWHLDCYIDLDDEGGFILSDGPFEGERAYFTRRGLDKMLGDAPDPPQAGHVRTTTHGGVTVHRVSNLRERLRAGKEEDSEIKIGGTD